MFLLAVYIFIALGFSFLCSIAEAVLLSVTSTYIAMLEQEGGNSGAQLRQLKENVDQPLAAILTLNTIAHTMGAAGAGAQAAHIFGSAYVGVISAVLTLLILIFSEIIPKTIGAHYWRELAPATACGLRYLIIIFYPFVKMSEIFTRSLPHGPTLTGYSREELRIMAEQGAQKGEINQEELQILKNLLLFNDTHIKEAMTPRTVIFALSQTIRVEEFFHKYDDIRFSRIPIYDQDAEDIIGFVLRSDLLLAQARGNSDQNLKNYVRDISAFPDTMNLLQAFNELLKLRAHIVIVINEYGSLRGILTLEDIIETLLGFEIVDEGDENVDMQKLARQLWKKRLNSNNQSPL